MQEKAIIGVDISKSKIDVCLVISNKIRHKVFDNNHDGYQKLLNWCKHQKTGAIHICMEATGHYMENLAHFMHDLGHDVSVINPAQIKAFTRSELLRGKTDKSDAAAIARFCQAHNPNCWIPKAKEVRKLRDMYRCLQMLKDEKQQMQNRLENENMDKQAKYAILRVIDVMNKEIDNLKKKIIEHIDNYPDLKKKVQSIIEIKGIGITTACGIIAEMPEVDNFENARQYAAFAGLTPMQHQSGSSVQKKARICKIGSERVRKALYMSAIVIKNHNENFAKFCQKLANNGKLPKVIIVAVMRKVLHIIYGMLKNHTKFNPELL